MDLIFEKINNIIQNRKYKQSYNYPVIKRMNRYEKRFRDAYDLEDNETLNLKKIHKITRISIYNLNKMYEKGGMNYVYKEIILCYLYISEDA